jgi:hypothetical protein
MVFIVLGLEHVPEHAPWPALLAAALESSL